MKNNLSKILETDKEHQLLFDLFFDNYQFEIDYSKINYNRLFALIVKKHRIINYFFTKADLLLFPNNFIEQLKIARIKQKKNALKQLQILVEINKILVDFDFMVLKGLPLSQQLYNDFAYRDSSDVDILIKPKDEVKIIELLSSNGFERAFNYEHHYVLKRFGISIEVHRKLSAIFNTKDIEENMWASKSYVEINNSNFRVANSNEIYNYYLINASTHYFKRLSYWIELNLMKNTFNYTFYSSSKRVQFIFDDIFLNGNLNTYVSRVIANYFFYTKSNNIITILNRTIYFAKISNYSSLKTFYKRASFFIYNKFSS